MPIRSGGEAFLFTIDRTTYRSPNYDERPAGTAISAIVLHHGAGTRASDLAWLCNPASDVSAQYYVCRDGTIYQLVDDAKRAWHAGESALAGVPHVNDYSIGIEAEHTTDPKLIAAGNPAHTDWPPVQQAAIVWLIRKLVADYPRITADRTVSHRAVALPAGRKPDPSHAPFAPEPSFRAWVSGVFAAMYDVAASPVTRPYTEDSPILAVPPGDEETFVAALLERAVGGNYDAKAVNEIARGYWAVCQRAGVDAWLAAGQCMHETGWLTSFWSARPQRNSAGLGVTGEWRDGLPTNPAPGPDWAYNSQRRRWERGLSFPTWVKHAIPAHVGRLLAYAVLPAYQTPEQAALVQYALSVRTLPTAYYGTAPTLKGLDRQWAAGPGYGGRVAAAANRLRGIVA